MEPPINRMSKTSVNSVITQKMMDEHVKQDTFTPPLASPLARSETILRLLFILESTVSC